MSKLTKKLKQDIAQFNIQIENTRGQLAQVETLKSQLNQILGMKGYAEGLLKKLEGESSAVCKEGKNDLQKGERVKEKGEGYER